MSIALISSEYKTANGTITIPTGCTRIYAFVKGSTIAPQISGTAMANVAAIDATSIIPALSVWQYIDPVIGVLNFTFTGTYVHFVYLSGAETFRPGVLFGYNSGGVYTGNMVTVTTDLAFGILCGSIGPTALKGDTVAMTYLVNATVDKVGYITPGDTLLTCEAADTGTTAGYTIPGEIIHHPAVLIAPEWHEYLPVQHPGYYTNEQVWFPGQWINPTGDGVHFVWISGHYETRSVWHPPYTTTADIYHPATYTEAYDEQLPDTVVPAGSSQISAIFCSIKTTAGGDYVSDAVVV
jgi:hypothetical protein